MNAPVTILEPETLEYLPAKTILHLVERYQRAGKNFKAMQSTLNSFRKLFRAFEDMDIEVRCSLDDGYIHVCFTGDGPRLASVWKLLRRAGYKTNEHPKKGDTSFYSFWRQEGWSDLFMQFTSSMCRRVQVGTKMVEQPIYETQCGELPTDLEIEAPKNAVVEMANDDIPF